MGFGLWNKSKARIGALYLPLSGLFINGTAVTATAAQINTVSSLAKPLNFVTVIDCSANPNYPAADAGDVYRVSVAGKIGGGAGIDVQANDSLICITTAVAGTHAAVGASWYIEQGNIVSTADVPETTDKNYVTDAQQTVIENTSGTNTGDNVEVAAQAVGFTITKGTTPKTLTVALDANVAGTNTGDSASDPAGSAAAAQAAAEATAAADATSKANAAQAAAEASVAALNPVAGLAAGYKVARSAAPEAVTGTLDIDTGLATVIACFASADSDFDGDALAAVQAVNTGGAGHILLKTWKVTTGGAAGNPTMVAATAAKNVHWLAIGT